MMKYDFILNFNDQENIEALKKTLMKLGTIQTAKNDQMSREKLSSSSGKETMKEDDLRLEIARFLQSKCSTSSTSSEITHATGATNPERIQIENASFLYNIQEYVEIECDPSISLEYTDTQEKYGQNTTSQFNGKEEEYIGVNNSAELLNNGEYSNELVSQFKVNTENEEYQYSGKHFMENNEVIVNEKVGSNSPVLNQQQNNKTKEDFLNFISVVLENTEYGRELLKHDGKPPSKPKSAKPKKQKPKKPKPKTSKSKIKKVKKEKSTTTSRSKGRPEEYYLITCYCGKPCGYQFMVECTRCFTWIHFSCSRLRRKSDAEKVDFKCAICKENMHLIKRLNLRKSQSSNRSS